MRAGGMCVCRTSQRAEIGEVSWSGPEGGAGRQQEGQGEALETEKDAGAHPAPGELTVMLPTATHMHHVLVHP